METSHRLIYLELNSSFTSELEWEEEHDNIRILLEKIKYADHQWKICGIQRLQQSYLGNKETQFDDAIFKTFRLF